MIQPSDAEAEILRSWNVNAAPWIGAIRAGSIASRILVTDEAIVEAVTGSGAVRVLDVGCGEGWLCRALAARGVDVTGVDAIASLVDEAARQGGGDFHRQDYDSIAVGRWRGGPFDAAVCNFSLLGRDSVASLLAGLGGYLAPAGWLIIQTLHPLAACGDNAYCDGWRSGQWSGFGPEFTAPAPWYFRTLESWTRLIARSGFVLRECREPTAPGAGAPSSVLFMCGRSP